MGVCNSGAWGVIRVFGFLWFRAFGFQGSGVCGSEVWGLGRLRRLGLRCWVSVFQDSKRVYLQGFTSLGS